MKPNIGIAVDCSVINGNPGNAEYRGIDLETGEILFEKKIQGLSTNNIAEFAALVEGVKWLRLIQNKGKVYTDSMTALAWYRRKKHKSKLEKTNSTIFSYDILDKSINQIPLCRHMSYVDFWSNKTYGEIPADYGRK